MPRKSTLAVLLVPACILLIPLVAMQFTAEVSWSFMDFALMYALMVAVGGTFRFLAGRSNHFAYRAAAAVGCGGCFLLIWVNLAVEVIGDDNPVNALYFLIPLVGLIGAGLARFAPQGLARATFLMAAMQMLVPVIALFVDRTNFSPGILGVFVLNGIFAAMFVFAGLLFQYSGRAQGGITGEPSTAR